MTLDPQITTTSGVIGAFSKYKTGLNVLPMLEEAFGGTATIDDVELTRRCDQIREEMHKLDAAMRPTMQATQQTGILDRDCPFRHGIGYVRRESVFIRVPNWEY